MTSFFSGSSLSSQPAGPVPRQARHARRGPRPRRPLGRGTRDVLRGRGRGHGEDAGLVVEDHASVEAALGDSRDLVHRARISPRYARARRDCPGAKGSSPRPRPPARWPGPRRPAPPRRAQAVQGLGPSVIRPAEELLDVRAMGFAPEARVEHLNRATGQSMVPGGPSSSVSCRPCCSRSGPGRGRTRRDRDDPRPAAGGSPWPPRWRPRPGPAGGRRVERALAHE